MENSDLKKFNEQYESIMDWIDDIEMSGGAKKAENSDTEVVVDDSKRFVVKVNCVNVTQKREGFGFDGRICKTPSIHIKFKHADVKMTKVVRALIKYVNKRLRMSNIEEVEIVKGKKKTKYDGDKLGDMINVSELEDLDEVNIKMN